MCKCGPDLSARYFNRFLCNCPAVMSSELLNAGISLLLMHARKTRSLRAGLAHAFSSGPRDSRFQHGDGSTGSRIRLSCKEYLDHQFVNRSARQQVRSWGTWTRFWDIRHPGLG
jgi:hypothetical protein